MAPDKNAKTKGVENRTVRLIVDAAESALRHNPELNEIEFRVNHVDREDHPTLNLDLRRITQDAIHELKVRIEDVRATLENLYVIEFGRGSLIANLEFTQEDVRT